LLQVKVHKHPNDIIFSGGIEEHWRARSVQQKETELAIWSATQYLFHSWSRGDVLPGLTTRIWSRSLASLCCRYDLDNAERTQNLKKHRVVTLSKPWPLGRLFVCQFCFNYILSLNIQIIDFPFRNGTLIRLIDVSVVTTIPAIDVAFVMKVVTI